MHLQAWEVPPLVRPVVDAQAQEQLHSLRQVESTGAK
jgi:hypothetical protein